MSQYKAIAEFRINLNGGADPVLVKPGTVFSFDGMNVVVTDAYGMEKKGVAPMLTKVEGEWFIPVAPIKTAALSTDLNSKGTPVNQVPAPKVSDQPVKTIASTGAIAGDNIAVMINQYEEQSGLKDKEGPTIINDDASIVGQVRKTAGQVGQKNTAGVQIENSEIGPKKTVYREQQTVKQTQYNPTLDASEPKRQRPQIISDSEGVVIASKRANKIKSKNANEINQNTRVNDEMGVIAADETVAKETTYKNGEPVDVTGSSTQAQLTQTPKIASNPKRAAEEKAKRMAQIKTISIDGQEGVVVGKVRKDEDTKTSSEGFITKLTVGSTNDDITGLEATVSSGEVNISDIEATVGSGNDLGEDEAQIIESDTDDNVDDILSSM
jgi:hypothetical protein